MSDDEIDRLLFLLDELDMATRELRNARLDFDYSTKLFRVSERFALWRAASRVDRVASAIESDCSRKERE